MEREQWSSGRILALRHRLGLTQREFASKLGMRQQTVSEWETGMYEPRGGSLRLLSMIAENAGLVGGDSAKKLI